jgi:hypothetical protein
MKAAHFPLDGNFQVAQNLTIFKAVVVLSLVLHSTQPAKAQSATDDSARIESARSALVRIPLESRIRIITVGHNAIEGRLAALSDSGIVILQRRDTSRASIARVGSVWRPAANFKSGAITGGSIGAILGALTGGTFASGLCDRADCHGAFANGASVGAVLGAGLGAAIGLGVGALTHHWQRVWP